MANVAKFTRAACGHMWAHYERARDASGNYFKFGNQSIDPERSCLNYNLATHQTMRQGDFVKKRCGEVKVQNRKDVNVMCTWIVTAPKDLPADEQNDFFKACYDFLEGKYGKENVVSAYVHMDETTPHMHFAFVPVVPDRKRNRLKVSAKELLTRQELRRFHPALQEHVQNRLGHEVGILNGATAGGNKTITELKAALLAEEVAEQERQLRQLKKDCENIIASAPPSVLQKLKHKQTEASLDYYKKKLDEACDMYPGLRQELFKQKNHKKQLF